jgi:hypothetical protein
MMNRKNVLKIVCMLAAFALVWLVAGQCVNKKRQESKVEKREIWENRTDGYLERVAADAELTYRDCQKRYDECRNNPEKFDSTKIKGVEKAMDEARNVQSTIVYYQTLLHISSKERTEEDTKVLERVYNICWKMENDGWGWQTSKRLVEQMEQSE